MAGGISARFASKGRSLSGPGHQDRAGPANTKLAEPVHLVELINRFFSHDESDEREFQRAMEEFKSRIPSLSHSLREQIDNAHKKNRYFREAFGEFVALCRASLNPELSDTQVDYEQGFTFRHGCEILSVGVGSV